MRDDPAVTIHVLAAELGRAADVLLAGRHGISFARYRLLRALRRDGAATQHALAHRLGVGDAAVSRILPGLVEQGWCLVDSDPQHARRRQVRLTGAGIELERDCATLLGEAFHGAAVDAAVDAEALLTAAEAVTDRVRSSMHQNSDRSAENSTQTQPLDAAAREETPTTAEARQTPDFDRELRAAMESMGMQTMAVGITPDGIPAERETVGRLTPSFDEIASDSRFAVFRLVVPGLPGNAAVGLLVATPVGDPSGCPVLFTTHGGGLITGNNRFGLPGVLDLAADFAAVVVSVEYRLAPEHPYPAAHDDAYAALLWTARHAAEIGGDEETIVLHGGSAGANLAAGLALRARDSGELRPRGQMLIYPMLDDRNGSASARQMRGRGVWDEVSNRTAWDSVLGTLRGEPPAYAAPARARRLSGLPPTYLEAGSAETFRDETIAYADRIWSSGGDAELHVWPGAFHGFDLFVPHSTVARRARATRREWITRLLHGR